MSSTSTSVTELKIHRGTYNVIENNISSINENELILITDKTVPVPTSTDSGKIISVNSSGEYQLSTPSSGGGTQLYQHDFTITDVNMGTTTIETYRAITTSSTAFTISTIRTDLIYTLMFIHSKTNWGWTTCIYNYGLYVIYEFTGTSASNCQSLMSISNVTDVVTAL